MLRPNLRKYTTGLYLLVLAVVDTLVLYTGLLRHWIRELFGTDVRNGSIAACRIHHFVLNLAVQVEAWIIVCVGIEKMVAVFFPHKAKQIFTREFAARQMAIIGAILAVVNNPFCCKWGVCRGCQIRTFHKRHLSMDPVLPGFFNTIPDHTRCTFRHSGQADPCQPCKEAEIKCRKQREVEQYDGHLVIDQRYFPADNGSYVCVPYRVGASRRQNEVPIVSGRPQPPILQQLRH